MSIILGHVCVYYCHQQINILLIISNVSLGSPPRIAVLTAGYKGLSKIVKNKVNVVVVVVVVLYGKLHERAR